MAPVTALVVILLGIALWTLPRTSGQVPRLASAIALATGLAYLVAVSFGIALFGQTVSVAACVILITASGALLIQSLVVRSETQQVVLGVGGLVLLSLSATVLIARSAGVLDMEEQQIAGASYPTLFAGALLGGFFLLTVFTNGLGTAEPPAWLAVGGGLAALVVVLIVWLGLVAREGNHIVTQTRLALDSERLAILRDIDASERAILRAAVWAAGGVDPHEFRNRFAVMVAERPGLIGGGWFPAGGPPSVVLPSGLEVAQLDRVWLGPAGDTARAERIVYAPLDSARGRVAIVASACGAAGCGGGLVGVLDAAELFDRVRQDGGAGYQFEVAGPTGPLVSGSAPASRSKWEQRSSIALGSSSWEVTAQPTAAGLSGLRSDLPATVLFMGLLVAGLVPVTLRLGQVARVNALDAARARVAGALERATDGVWELDLTRGKAVRSASLWHHLRYEPASPNHDDRWFTLIHPDDQLPVDRELKRHLSGETDRFEVEYRLRAGDGSWHRIVDRGRIVDRDPTGKPSRLLGISADVTEAIAAAAARDESESRFQAVFDSAFQLQLLLDLDGRVVAANQSALQQGGVTRDDLIGRPCWTILWWATNSIAAAGLEKAIAACRKGDCSRFTEELIDPDGSTRILELALTPIPDAVGQPLEFLLEGRDETARRRAEVALQEVSTLTTMGRLAARVAHEINNPLAGIQNAFLLVKDAIGADHPHLLYVSAIEREISRIAAVTKQLYETYRPETESTPEASVATIAADAAALLEQLNKPTGVRIATDLHDVPAVVPFPSAMIRQIVFNLLQNAVDASPPNGTVSIRAAVAPGGLVIAVRDQGSGVPSDLTERIWEPFFSTKGRDVKTGGMGIGLSLVQRSVAAVGGRITVRSGSESGAAGEGPGAEFVVELPLDRIKGGRIG
jgi:PAS domain S-box-containing protein